jgi:hypothetical protein
MNELKKHLTSGSVISDLLSGFMYVIGAVLLTIALAAAGAYWPQIGEVTKNFGAFFHDVISFCRELALALLTI